MYLYRYNHPIQRFNWKQINFGLTLVAISSIVLMLSLNIIKSINVSRGTAKIDQALKQATSTVPVKAPIQENDLLELVNKERVNNKLHPLKMNDKLALSAAAKCKDMADNNYWSHVGSKGQQPWNYINTAGYKHITAGENLAYGFNQSSIVVQAWMNSPEHRAVLLNKTYTETGFATCASSDYISSGPQTIVVEHLALGAN